MTTLMNVPSPVKMSNVSVAVTITGKERILAVRVCAATSVAKTISIPVSLLEIYTSIH